ncbi:MAG TPA: sensor histidine kinase, partial [Anaerolineales bacterium]|nr:sensor histidine kinase [Anaerolineales bacterium]
AVVVLASYFATFSTIKEASAFKIILMVGLGVAYITLGIYGYKYCARSANLILQLAYFAVQIPLGAVIVYLSKGAGYNALVLLPLAGHSVVLLPSLWLYLTNTILVIVYVLALSLSLNDWSAVWSGLPTFLAGVVFIMVFTQMAVSEEQARMEVERLLKDLGDANQQLREYALKVEELAITSERNRLAREIHDGLGHFLTTIHMQIQAAVAVMKTDPTRAQKALESAQSMTQEALLDVRRSVSALHSKPEEALPLPESITRVLHACEPAGIEAVFDVVGTPRDLSPQAQLTMYRAAQETVNNACKHSRATQLTMTLDYSIPNLVRLCVKDNGQGAEKMEGGFGLVGLRERAHLLEGDFQVRSSKGQGFEVEIMVPG